MNDLIIILKSIHNFVEFNNIQGCDPEIIDLYWKIEQKCRKYTKVISCYIILNQSMYTAAIIVSVCDMLNNNYDTSNWLLPWGVPFDTDNLTVFQWYLLWFEQFSFGLAYSSSTLTVTSFFVSGCLYLGGLCDHFAFLFKSIENDLKLNENEKNIYKLNIRRQLIKAKLCKAIRVHMNLYE